MKGDRSEGPQPHIIDLTFPKRVSVAVSLDLTLSALYHLLGTASTGCVGWEHGLMDTGGRSEDESSSG